MGKFRFILMILFGANHVFAQVLAPSFLWEYSHNVNTKQMVSDHNGNLYVCGDFTGTVDLDISSAVCDATSTDNGFGTFTSDAYLAKYGASGNLLWKIVLASTIDYETYHDVVTDAVGNVYVFGTTTNSVNINPMGAAFYLPVTGNFMAKYSPYGKLQWAYHSDIDLPDMSFAVNYKQFLTIDQSTQNLLIAGFINGTVDADPSPTNSYMLYDTTISSYRKTFVITKFDSNGNFVLAADFEGAISNGSNGGASMEFSRIKTDNGGNVWLLCQIYQYNVDLDPSATIQNVVGSGGLNTGCIAKYNSNFQLLTFKTLTNSRFSTIAFDSQNNLLLAGDFATALDFDFGAGSAILDAGPSTMDFFIGKYDGNFNYIWAFTHGNTQYNFSRISMVSIDVNDNIIVQGDYDLNSSQSDFDPTVAGTYTLNGYGSFIAKYSPSKTLLAIGTIPQLNNYGNYMHYNKITNKIDYFGTYGGVGNNTTYDFDMTSGVYNETSSASTTRNFTARYNLSCEYRNPTTIRQTICYNDTLHMGTQTFNTSGIYPVLYPLTSGCDSIVKLNLNVIPNKVAVSHTICSTQGYNFNGTVLTTNGVYTTTLTNILSCDSIVTLTLTVVPLDTSVTLSNYVLSASELFITYQWYNCVTGTIINGANSQNHSVNLTADYAVILSKSGCKDTTNCVHVAFLEASSQLPGNLWGNQMASLNVKAYTVDKNGNSYLVGYQLPQIDLDPGAATMIPSHIVNGLYMLKYNYLGNFLWAKWIEPLTGSTGSFSVNSVNVDTSGALIISGGFLGSFDVDASAASNAVYSTAFSSPKSDIFMMKYNADGSFAWFNQFGAGLTNYITDTYVDGNNHVYAVGYIEDNIDFDPGAGVVYLNAYKGFIAKYDANGSYISGVGMDDNITVNQITGDLQNQIFVSGDFTQTKDIAPGISNQFYIGDIYSGTSSSYVSKLDTNFNFVAGMGVLSDNTIRIIDMITDSNGKLNITGTYNTAINNFNYNGSPISLTYAGGGDCFLAQYNTNLELNWIRGVANAFIDSPKQLVIDSINNMCVLGTYKMDIDVDGTTGMFNLGGDFSTNDNYMVSYNQNGYFNWGIKLGSAANDEAVGIGMDKVGNIYACINASNTVIYSKDSQNNNQEFGVTTGAGAYFAKYGYCSLTNANVATNGNYLSTNIQNGTYQWYDCSTSQLIPGETNNNFFPTTSGYFGVLLSNNKCQIMSNCVNFVVTSIKENHLTDIMVYPNPTNGLLTITSATELQSIEVATITGQVLLSQSCNSKSQIVQLQSFAEGIYFVKVVCTNGMSVTKKVVVNR